MSPIWKLVGITVLVTVCGGLLWHTSEMHRIKNMNDKKSNVVREEIKMLTAYHEVLKRDGLEKANEYLQQIPVTPYDI